MTIELLLIGGQSVGILLDLVQVMLGHGLEDGGQEGQPKHRGCLVLGEGLTQRGDMAEAHPPGGARGEPGK